MRKYFTMIVRTPGQLWTPEFGDFDRKVVECERDDTKEDWPEGTQFKIICTGDKQADITAAVELENEKVKP